MTASVLFLAVIFLCVLVLPSGGIAQADEADWESGYIDYISSLDEDDLGEWYFDENNLNIEGVRDIIDEFL